jgi:DNA-binding transcriptional LysR family regulator
MRGSDFAELRAFAAIVEHGGFARAAAQLVCPLPHSARLSVI